MAMQLNQTLSPEIISAIINAWVIIHSFLNIYDASLQSLKIFQSILIKWPWPFPSDVQGHL